MAQEDPQDETTKEDGQDKEAASEDGKSEQKPEKKSEKKKKKPVRRQGESVRLGPDIEIFCEARLPDFDMGIVKAYDAAGTGNKSGNYFAMVCERHLVPRSRAASVYASLINPSMASLIMAGVVYWPPAKEERYVLVYKNNLGKKLMKDDAPPALGWHQDTVMSAVITPMIGVLQDLRDKDFVHGAIRPSNMYDGGATAGPPEKVILGECLSVPNGYMSSVLYETIERGMADPLGRGPGTKADDMYAFGVSLTVLLRSADPLEGKNDEELLREKIARGTYAAITGKDRFRGSILELLRGVLNDDPSQRWTVDEVLVWLDGRRLSPKQSVRQKKAARPITLNGKKYLNTPLLAMDLHDNTSETMKMVEQGDLEQWLSRSLEDEKSVKRMEAAVNSAADQGRGPGYEERLISHLSTALDPLAPIRYRGLRMMGSGVGTALAETVVLKKDVATYADIFSQGIAMNWVSNQENPNVDTSAMIGKFDSCRSFIRLPKPGYGIERCLYLLCPEVHCLSETLKNYVVRSPEEMIEAFEDLCEKGKTPAMFLDRHSIAFLSVKDHKVIDSYLFELGAEEHFKRVLGTVKCLATIQKRGDMGSFPKIAEAMVEMLPVVYKRYHDRNVREKLQKNINRYAREGDLVKIAGLLDNVEVTNKDFSAFRHALHEYALLRKEHANLELRLGDKSNFGKTTGKEIAAVISSVISSVVILGIAFMFFTGKTVF